MSYIKSMSSFKENLRGELDFQGLTVKELAARTGIVKGTIDNYLGARESIPPADIAGKIAQALNVSVEYLVTGMRPGTVQGEVGREASGTLKIEDREMLKALSQVPRSIQTSFKTLIYQVSEMAK